MRVVDDLKDENEQYRKMVMETIEQILTNMGATDIDNRLEEQLIDGILYAFQVTYSMIYHKMVFSTFSHVLEVIDGIVYPYFQQKIFHHRLHDCH